MTDNIKVAQAFAHAHHIRFLDELIDFSSIPSVSTDPHREDEMQIAAGWVSKKLRSLGLEKVEIYPTEGHPIVYGEWQKVGKTYPTVLIYGHYDVQPAEPLDKWDSDPFKPEVRGEYVYARGISDMKGQVTAAINAVESIVRTSTLPVNLKFLIEGEEEIGSPHLASFIMQNKDLLTCDFALNTDTGMIAPDLPTITYALRGLAYFEIRIWGPRQDLHSGVFGGTVHNPAQALAELIAGMHDNHGRVTLPGFYNKVILLGEDEREEMARLPKNEQWYLANTGVPALWGEDEYTPDERVGGRPTLEVHGLLSGFTGEGGKTVLPSYAMAKISCRLVPDQDPDEVHQQFLDYCKKNAPATIKWEISYIAGGTPSLSNRDSAWVQAYYKAAKAVWGVNPAFKREGGSVPVVSDFKNLLGVETVNTGFGLPTDNMHGPNEKLHLPTWYKGTDALVSFFLQFGEFMSDQIQTYGGQAVIEGVMMRGARTVAIAMRAPNKEIVIRTENLGAIYKSKLIKIPFLRGLVLLWDALGLGTRALTTSANIQTGEDEQLEGPALYLTIGLSLAIAVGLFFMAPAAVGQWMQNYLGWNAWWSNLGEGAVRLLLLVGYIWAIGFMPDIRRVFAYHGAEHKTINAYEAGAELTPEIVSKYSLEHPRCGTSFLLTLVLLSVVIFSAFGPLSLAVRLVTRILFIPILAGIAYEYIRWTANHMDSVFVKRLIRPNMALQHLTTREPSLDILEVSISAFNAMMKAENEVVV